MGQKRQKKDPTTPKDSPETNVDETPETSLESATEDEVQVEDSIPTDMDMEAAMEEDIAGDAEGVSRRNPTPGTATTFPPLFGTVQADGFGSPRPLRSGMEEADWFNRFRERLFDTTSQAVTSEATPEVETEDTHDPDDPPEDEAQAYSEQE